MSDLAPHLTEDEAKALAQLQFLQMLETPVELPVNFNVEKITMSLGPGILLLVQTPAGSQRLVLARDGALQLADKLREMASGILVAQPGTQVPRA